MDDVLHEGEEIAIEGDCRREGDPPASDKPQSRSYDRADDQNEYPRAERGINEGAGYAGEEADFVRPVDLDSDRCDFGAALAAEFLGRTGWSGA